jgi:hypothetical protein
MTNLFPIVAGVVIDGENKNVHLEWTLESDPYEPDDLIICLSQVDRETIPGQSAFLHDNDIYISLANLKRLCLLGLRVYKDTTAIVHLRQAEAIAELNEMIASLQDEEYEE